MKHMGQQWRKLPEAEKEKYKSRVESSLHEYSQKLKKWEEKMIRLGNLAFVRTHVLNARQAQAVASMRENTASAIKSAKK